MTFTSEPAWYVDDGHQKTGPFSVAKIRELLNQGKIQPHWKVVGASPAPENTSQTPSHAPNSPTGFNSPLSSKDMTVSTLIRTKSDPVFSLFDTLERARARQKAFRDQFFSQTETASQEGKTPHPAKSTNTSHSTSTSTSPSSNPVESSSSLTSAEPTSSGGRVFLMAGLLAILGIFYWYFNSSSNSGTNSGSKSDTQSRITKTERRNSDSAPAPATKASSESENVAESENPTETGRAGIRMETVRAPRMVPPPDPPAPQESREDNANDPAVERNVASEPPQEFVTEPYEEKPLESPSEQPAPEGDPAVGTVNPFLAPNGQEP